MIDEDKKNKFLEAYDAYSDALYRHCFFRTFSRERAEELVQETFLKTWEYVSQDKEIANIRAFLYRVALNLIIDDSRKKKEVSLDALLAGSKNFQPPNNSHRIMEIQALFGEAMKGLKLLEEEDRNIIILRYVDDLGPGEIAEILGTNANVVSVRINRALEKLKKKTTHEPR